MPKLVLGVSIYMKQMTSADAILDKFCRSRRRVKLCHLREKDIISNVADCFLVQSDLGLHFPITNTIEHSKINFAAQNISQYELDKSKTATM